MTGIKQFSFDGYEVVVMTDNTKESISQDEK